MTTNQLYQLLLENLTTSVLLLNEELRVIYANPASEAALSTSSQRIIGAPLESLFKEPEKVTQALRDALFGNNPFTERQADLNLNENHITVDYTVTPVHHDSGALLLIEMQPVDRIMKINREAALLSTHDTSRNLIRGLAHEIKNPLGGIQGAVQLLSEELTTSDREGNELHEYTEIISLEVNRLRNLVDDLLGSNRPPRFAPVNFHEIIEHVASLVEAETQGSIEIIRNYDPSIPDITADRERLIQALLNITRNAVQALQGSNTEPPVIELKTRIQRHFTINKRHHRAICKLEIIDNGPGIPDDIADRIFFPMISGHNDGTGLGLPIAQSAINLHQGLIECHRKDHHTVFTLYLPMETLPAEPLPTGSSPTGSLPTGNSNVR